MSQPGESSEKPKKFERKIYATGSSYLAPSSCDSTISYKIVRGGGSEYYDYFTASINLTDCNRKISWDFPATDYSIEKIDAAISALTEFRKEFIKARKDYLKDHPKEKGDD